MRIVVIVLIALLLSCIGGAAFFYTSIHQPLAEKVATSIPELDRTKAELTKYKQKEKLEAAWINPLLDAVALEFAEDIKTGAIEVFSTGSKLVVNIAEQSLFMPGSRIFAKDSPRLLTKLDTLLRSERIKGKDIVIGNSTPNIPPQAIGRKRIPGKDGRALAAERSAELIKYLEKKGVKPELLIAAAYAPNQATAGIKIKDRKTVIIIETPASAPMTAPKQAADAQTKPTTTAVSSAPATTATPTVPAAPAVRSSLTPTAASSATSTAARPTAPQTPVAQPKPTAATKSTPTTPAAPANTPTPKPHPAQPKTN